jgi:hypothetical protein
MMHPDTIASPWAALLNPQTRWVDVDCDDRPGTKLAGLLRQLSDRADATTPELASLAGMTSRQVWGLLKAPRDCGQVQFVTGRWSLATDFHGRDVQRAVALLRNLGWLVEPPNAS